MYVQLKKLMASKYSSSLCDGYVSVSNLNTKVWGFCFSFSSCFFLLFVWLSECSCGQTGLVFFSRMISNAPTLPKSEGAATLRKSYIWKWEIYKASLLLFSLQCCIYVLKWFCLLRMKKCKEYLAFFFFFLNDNIWVLDFEIRSLNIKKL